MRISAVAALMIVTTILLSGCGQTQTAALDDRSQNFYGRGGIARASIPGGSGGYSMAAPVDMVSVSSSPVTSAYSTTPMTTASNSAMPFGRASQPLGASSGWQWPVSGQVTERFGARGVGISNEGITIAAAEGTPIRAAQAGEVAFVGTDVPNFGHMVILRHATGTMSSYAHARRITVAKGAQVPGGATLGYVGQTGGAKAPGLHFALREGDRAIDPLSKLPSQMAAN